MNKLETFEFWLYRRNLKIRWTVHIINEDVMSKIGTDIKLRNTVTIRKVSYLGHIMRNRKYHFQQLIIQRKIEGKRGRVTLGKNPKNYNKPI